MAASAQARHASLPWKAQNPGNEIRVHAKLSFAFWLCLVVVSRGSSADELRGPGGANIYWIGDREFLVVVYKPEELRFLVEGSRSAIQITKRLIAFDARTSAARVIAEPVNEVLCYHNGVVLYEKQEAKGFVRYVGPLSAERPDERGSHGVFDFVRCETADKPRMSGESIHVELEYGTSKCLEVLGTITAVVIGRDELATFALAQVRRADELDFLDVPANLR